MIDSPSVMTPELKKKIIDKCIDLRLKGIRISTDNYGYLVNKEGVVELANKACCALSALVIGEKTDLEYPSTGKILDSKFKINSEQLLAFTCGFDGLAEKYHDSLFTPFFEAGKEVNAELTAMGVME